MNEKTLQPQDKYVVRFPDGMRDQIKAEAEKSGRSMNGEIIHRLAATLKIHVAFAEQAAWEFPEELTFHLLNEASWNNRSFKEEVIERLQNSLHSHAKVENRIYDLEKEKWRLQEKVDELTRLLMQATPYERLVLEEREYYTNKKNGIGLTSGEMKRMLEMKPIGDRGRRIFNVRTDNNA
ncbi:Arc family DNA-binding protein [Pararhizobium arenae]|uniref:Arc family DNA-binding protein n=1 Tax=Pararhizobium arenae TaxID=1856850 RepID=UPI00094ACFC9|nr:Arc family DNA-binding protein [Pararhizobium arenae]